MMSYIIYTYENKLLNIEYLDYTGAQDPYLWVKYETERNTRDGGIKREACPEPAQRAVAVEPIITLSPAVTVKCNDVLLI